MINWNDVRVVQELAQERYEVIVQGRELARFQRLKANPGSKASNYVRVRNWLGGQLVNWGCHLKAQCDAASVS